MKPDLARSSWDDLVFESRNKEYGAYPIRKSYDDSIAKGFFTALLFAVFAFGVIQVASLLHLDVKAVPKPPTLTKLADLPIIIRDRIMKKQEVKTEKAVNKDLLERIVTQEVASLHQSNVTEPTSDGNESMKGTGEDLNFVADYTSTDVSSPAISEQPKVFDTAEVMPQYEGGMKAMIKFLSKQLHYPVSERSIGHEGTVYVRFVINSVGQVVDVEVIKGVSVILDREAVRVVSMMTKWKPGMQHDLPVNVRMVLPIRFHMEQM